MKRIYPLAVIALVLATGCASSGSKQYIGVEEWKIGVAERHISLAELVYPFESTPEIDEWAHANAGTIQGIGPISRLNRLQVAMFDRDKLDFDYEEEMTLTAAEAFTRRRGNCLSFTALFVAASRSLGIKTFLVSVRRPPEIEKKGDLVVVNDHVVAGYYEGSRLHIYDFYVTSAVPYFQQKVIDDLGATAMYHNNMGGSEIRMGNFREAIQHLNLATRLDPSMTAAWVNLGVARHRNGNESGAIEAYNRALTIDPNHSSALTNMAYVYKGMGLEAKYRQTLEAAARTKSSQFTLIALADTEIEEGNFQEAARYLSKARRMDSKEPEVYLAMARLAIRSGDLVAAGKLRSQARKYQKIKEKEGPGQ
jgi:Flp pilus assembly protein TadD